MSKIYNGWTGQSPIFFCGFLKNCYVHNSLKNDAINSKFGTELNIMTLNKIQYKKCADISIFGKIRPKMAKNAKSPLGPPWEIEVKNERDYGKNFYAVLIYIWYWTELLYKISSDLDKWFRFYGNLNF